MLPILPLLLALLAADDIVQSANPSADPSWISEEPGAVELLLAHQDSRGPDVGILRVDAARHGIAWAGTGPQACARSLQASFDDVAGLRTRREGGFILEIKGPTPTTLVLIPLPHAAWLASQHAVNPGRMDSFLESSDVFVGRGAARSAGNPGANAPTFERKDPPPDVVSDTHRAMDHVLAAMGRLPSPDVVLKEAFYGRPQDLTVAELLEQPGPYVGRAVRLSGTLEALPDGTYRLRDADHALTIRPGREVAALVQAEAARGGRLEAEITGACTTEVSGAVVAFWSYSSLAAETPAAGTSAPLFSLAALVAAPRDHRDLVRVRGLFRGRNLYADLPPSSMSEPGDWVMKDQSAAVWVTGHPPQGRGWSLDGSSAGDTAQWLEVVGRATLRRGAVRVRAVSVTPIAAPAGSSAAPARRLVATPDVPPEVIFAMPLPGDPVAVDSRFALQFNAYLDAESLPGHVVLRYVDGGTDVPARVAWDEIRRTVVVSPVDPLQHGRTVEVRLLPGIRDTQGRALRLRADGEAPSYRWPVQS